MPCRLPLWTAALVLLAGRPLLAQFSPGPLSRAHAALEGTARCQSCHERQAGVSAERCLTCHTYLRERIAAGRGLHARPGYARCETCHVEHHGRDFQLVWWGKQGRAAFDHDVTGFELEGAHERAACESCHQARNIRERQRLAMGGVNLARTFLGLAAACASCHRDPHAGQFAPRGCESCHEETAWLPPAGFRHDQTRFPLTGRHAQVACDSCHPAAREPSPHRRFRGVAFATCASCHRDPHAGRLGGDCASCHTTAGWGRVDRGEFDHDRTAFPLRGRHARLDCAACHAGTATRRLAHARCTDCHADRHRGQLTHRADRGRCESCHTVEGFKPARFGMEEHAATRFPLTGAHRAVPCDECHREVPVSALRAAGVPASGPGLTEQLRFASLGCATCHQDPHRGQAERFSGGRGCAGCHSTERWEAAAFDHARTRFPLAGRHAALSCADCHGRGRAGGDAGLPFAGLSRDCAACHADPHAGQLVSRGGAPACDRCHNPAGWARIRFDHDRETAFPLTGAHRAVACSGCHRAEKRDGRTVVRYRGLGTSCRDCHGARP